MHTLPLLSFAGPFVPRSFDDYLRHFGLSIDALRGRRILDFPAGAGTFAAEAALHDIDVVAADPRYGRSQSALALQAEAFPGFDRYGRTVAGRRLLSQFLDDYYREFPNGRYVPAQPTELPFADASFDLVVSRDFLFPAQPDSGDSIQGPVFRELLRVARSEVRIYPVSDDRGRPVAGLDRLMAQVADLGFHADCVAFDWSPARVTETLVLRRVATGVGGPQTNRLL